MIARILGLYRSLVLIPRSLHRFRLTGCTDPDRMPDPVLGKIEQDHLDEEIPFMRYAIWADAINGPLARIVKARY